MTKPDDATQKYGLVQSVASACAVLSDREVIKSIRWLEDWDKQIFPPRSKVEVQIYEKTYLITLSPLARDVITMALAEELRSQVVEDLSKLKALGVDFPNVLMGETAK